MQAMHQRKPNHHRPASLRIAHPALGGTTSTPRLLSLVVGSVVLIVVGQGSAGAQERLCASYSVEHPCVTFFQYLLSSSKKETAGAQAAPEPLAGSVTEPDQMQIQHPSRQARLPTRQSIHHLEKTVSVGPVSRPVVHPVKSAAHAAKPTSNPAQPAHSATAVEANQKAPTTADAAPAADPGSLPPSAARGIRADEPSSVSKPAQETNSLPPAADQNSAQGVRDSADTKTASGSEVGADPMATKLVATPDAVADVPVVSTVIAARAQPSATGTSERRSQMAPDVIAMLLESGRRLSAFDFPIEVGVHIPDDVNLAVIPIQVVAQAPELGGQFFIIVGDKVVVADPETRQIRQIIAP
jgi:hypothetical protein